MQFTGNIHEILNPLKNTPEKDTPEGCELNLGWRGEAGKKYLLDVGVKKLGQQQLKPTPQRD